MTEWPTTTAELRREIDRLRADLARVVIANAEVAKLNAEQAETIERLRGALEESHEIIKDDVATQEALRLRGALLIIRDGFIPQGMSPGLFAQKVLAEIPAVETRTCTGCNSTPCICTELHAAQKTEPRQITEGFTSEFKNEHIGDWLTNPAAWDLCDEHETTFPMGAACPKCTK